MAARSVYCPHYGTHSATVTNQDGGPLRAVRIRRAEGAVEVRALLEDALCGVQVVDAFVCRFLVLHKLYQYHVPDRGTQRERATNLQVANVHRRTILADNALSRLRGDLAHVAATEVLNVLVCPDDVDGAVVAYFAPWAHGVTVLHRISGIIC